MRSAAGAKLPHRGFAPTEKLGVAVVQRSSEDQSGARIIGTSTMIPKADLVTWGYGSRGMIHSK
jgi:hypothetical protein